MIRTTRSRVMTDGGTGHGPGVAGRHGMPRGIVALALLVLATLLLATASDARERLEYPEWFAPSLYDLPGDLDDAVARGKRGVALFFSAETCLHCVAMTRSTFQDPEVVRRLSGQFDVLAVDVFSDVEMVGLDGQMYRARELSEHERATFTPTLLFVDASGERMLRYVGFADAERMHLILGYLESDAWQQESLRDYAARLQDQDSRADAVAGAPASDTRLAGFQQPPADLAAQRTANPRPSLVLFERDGCEECRRLGEQVLAHPAVQEVLDGFHTLRLNTDRPGVAVLPDGRHGSAEALAAELALTHRPGLVFFAEDGEEAFRMDSTWLIDHSGQLPDAIRQDLLESFLARLEYVSSGAYRDWPQYQRWRAYRDRQG
ncbi:thioredoxin SoxW [Thioalkalivibrio nitratireducens DSM 14787]|uniref:Thioredoxin SoxW n=1 Tax=Thioalkalivibrio nitratireducens (strain DSM 14787 / UNIQEM 213 / ALEN2) TaxID=1255043 RepID=L0E064_THIND|nr:thioredoxin fold domain-containing protein [Thioalkalivibrio nitratireducens]AGA34688.1 thioredoxin SoxW [Thioalkalivibrio nitratireducens DSM 14787]